MWDVTCTSTLCATNVHEAAAKVGGAAAKAEDQKRVKYAALATDFEVVTLAFETHGPINFSGAEFIDNIGGRLNNLTGDSREKSFLWQHVSMAVCFHETFEQLYN